MASTQQPPLARHTTTGVAIALGLLAGSMTLSALPANAATRHSPAAKPVKVDHPKRDFAGSTIPHRNRHHPAAVAPKASLGGLDVSAYQGNVDWSSVASNGAKFAYVKATESTNYQSPNFTQQYNGSYKAGLIRGAYHFAVPSNSSGSKQADYFVGHGGGWSKDGKTLPPMLDIEYNPYGAECYGLSQSSMVSWIKDFVGEVHAKTSRWPTIYTTLDWWTSCTGNSSALSGNDPLFIARYASSAGTLPSGWKTWTFWQYADSGKFPGDQDYFNGDQSRLSALANG